MVHYTGFGGTKDPQPRYPREDPRFRWAAVMLKAEPSGAPAADKAFAVLSRMDFGTTKWSLVCDLARSRMYFRTSIAPKRRWVDLAAFDPSCTATPMALDIQRNLEGDVSQSFSPITAAQNKEAIARAFAEIDTGTLGNLFWKPRMVKGMGAVSETFTCARRAPAGK